jgi:hypothetical protein
MSSADRFSPASASRRLPTAGSKLSPRSRRLRLAAAGPVAIAGALAMTLAAASAQASQRSSVATGSTHYLFKTLDSHHDLTFNQLLGINNAGKIAGYFGSGAQGHPNKGYEISPPYGQGNFKSENFPHSVQTQVTGLNTKTYTVGFFSTQNNANGVNNNFGFYAVNGRHFRKVDFPVKHPASPPVDQLLGINNSDIAVGFFATASGTTQGYIYDIHHHKFFTLKVRGTSTAATGINDSGSICGFFTNSKGVTAGFFLRHTGQLFTLKWPHATTTQALGVNNSGEVVGFYMLGSGSTAVTHGFTWTRQHGFREVNDPNGKNSTTVNGINNAGDLVGFYTDSKGNTDGMIAVPVG